MIQSSDATRIMAACDSGLVTSGTADSSGRTLAGMPHVVTYKLDIFTWLLAIKVLKPLVMDKDIHVAIANVLAINLEKQGKGAAQRGSRRGLRDHVPGMRPSPLCARVAARPCHT